MNLFSTDTVSMFVGFQAGRGDFGPIWARLEPSVAGMARGHLFRRGVKGEGEWIDPVAVDEVCQIVAVKLLELPGKPAGSWFDPATGDLGGWLSGVCHNAVEDYCRVYRNARKRRAKVRCETDFPLNEQVEMKSIVKADEAKVEIDTSELREVMNVCVDEIESEELRSMVRLHFYEGVPQRRLAVRLGISPATVNRRLRDARRLIEASLRRRGIDGAWSADAA